MPLDAKTQSPGKRSRPPLRRVIGWTALLGIFVAGVLVYDHFTDAERIRGIARAYLQRFTYGEVSVGAASFSWLEGVRLFDVAVAPIVDWAPKGDSRASSDTRRGTAKGAGPVFSCREVRLTHGLWSAVFGKLDIRSIIALQPTCRIVRSPLDETTNLRGLFRAAADTAIDRDAATSLPTVELRNARVLVVSRDRDSDRIAEDLRITIRARPAQSQSQVYNVVWQEAGERRASGHSQIDLRTGHVRNVLGGLPWMSIEAVMLALNAKYDGAGAWCDVFGLEGVVRAEDYDLNGDAGTEGPRSATIELSNASISIPLDERERLLKPDERYVRFNRVNGHVRLTSEGMTAEFAGQFHGAECKVLATIRGGVDELETLDDIGFDARIALKGFMLPRFNGHGTPAEIRFINRQPPLARFFREYNPGGTGDLEVEVTKRAGQREPIVIQRMLLTARDGDALFRKFPYPLRHVTGTIEYTPEGVFLRQVRGEHGAGVVTVDGFLDTAAAGAVKELTITGVGISIDDALADALPPWYGKFQERFQPNGTVDVDLRLTQRIGTNGQASQWETKATIELRGVRSSFTGFPIPIDQLHGTLVVEGDRLRLIDVEGRSGQAQVTATGVALFDNGALSDLQVEIRGKDVAFDEALLAALPVEVQRKVRALHPSGRFDVQTLLSYDPQTKRVGQVSRVTLKDVSIRHPESSVEVTGILGQLRISPEETVFEGLTGRFRDAIVAAEGTIRRVDAQLATQLSFRARELHVDEATFAALPSKLRDALGEWRVDGPVDLDVVWTDGPAGIAGESTFDAVLRLSDVTVRHPSLPMPLTHVRGDITHDRTGTRATNVEGRYGDARLRLNLNVRRADGDEEGTITLSVTHMSLDDSLRGLLPQSFTETWDRLRPAGSIDVYLEELSYHRVGPKGMREWSVSGYVEFNHVAMQGFARLEQVSGTLVGSGAIVDRFGGTSLDGQLDLSAVSLMGQPITQVNGSWSFARLADGEGAVALDSFQARVHEGSLTGQFAALFDATRADYNVSATVHGMQIEPLVSAGRAEGSADGRPIEARGRLDGHVYLAGAFGNASTRRGGGRFEIAEGQIYRLPVILAILDVLNLSIPNRDAFDEARADFFVVGDRVQFRDIILRGGAMALVGSGSMSLPDCAVDLNLVNIGPYRWARVPVLADVVERASRELVELHVTGPWTRPTVRLQPFRGIREEFKQLFQKRESKKIQSVPS